MTPRAYYNEIDRFKAAWLRELIARNIIAQGEVDERSIVDVTAGDLAGFTQCHFFAGIGVWSYALRNAGWADAARVWTGSCPCQPFSDAGAGGGFDDPRHLWPDFYRLIGERRPDVVFGEQVASKAGLAWLDVVSADLEGTGYAIGSADLCAAGVGAPHIRQRLYWVADRGEGRRAEFRTPRLHGDGQSRDDAARPGATLWLVDGERAGLEGHGRHGDECDESRRLAPDAARSTPAAGDARGMADATGGERRAGRGGCHGQETAQRENRPDADRRGRISKLLHRPADQHGRFVPDEAARASATNGHWRVADWLLCTDGKWRPVEPGTFPLAHGAPARVGRLRGYGDAIVAEVATTFIEAYLDVVAERELAECVP